MCTILTFSLRGGGAAPDYPILGGRPYLKLNCVYKYTLTKLFPVDMTPARLNTMKYIQLESNKRYFSRPPIGLCNKTCV